MVKQTTMSNRSSAASCCCCLRLHVLVRCCRRRRNKQCKSHDDDSVSSDPVVSDKCATVDNTTLPSAVVEQRRTISDGTQDWKVDRAHEPVPVSFRIGVSDDMSIQTDSLLQLYEQSNPDLTRAWTTVYESIKAEQANERGADSSSNDMSIVASNDCSSETSLLTDDQLLPDTAKRRVQSMHTMNAMDKHHSINISPTVDASPKLDSLAPGPSARTKLVSTSVHRSVDTQDVLAIGTRPVAPSLVRSEVVDDLTEEP